MRQTLIRSLALGPLVLSAAQDRQVQEIFLLEGRVLVEDDVGELAPLETGRLDLAWGATARHVTSVDVRHGEFVLEADAPLEPPYRVQWVSAAHARAALPAGAPELEVRDGRTTVVLRKVQATKVVARDAQTEALLDQLQFRWLDPQTDRGESMRMPGLARPLEV